MSAKEELERVRDVKARHQESLFCSAEGVFSIGIGRTPEGRYCLQIRVAGTPGEKEYGFPAEIEGVPVQVGYGPSPRAL